MRYWSFCTFVGLGLGLGSVVCGCSNDDGTTTNSASGVSLEQLPTEYAAAYCSWLYRCCPSEQLTHMADAPIALMGNSEAECRTNLGALYVLLVPALTESEGKGRAHYLPEQARDCIDALKSSCANPETTCNGIIEPLVATGGACQDDGECVGHVCIGDTSDTDGTCGTPLATGEICTEDSQCQSDSCNIGECGEKTAIGGTCSTDSQCASAYCDFASHTCATAPYSGACAI